MARVKPLSPSQERRLVDFLDDEFLNITRNYKKRSDPSTTLPTLSSYLTTTHHLLSLIMQIPPLDPSTSLRITLLLRLTSDVMDSITGYKPDVETLPQLLDWLDDLDKAWLAVIRAQKWDTDSLTGVDILLDSDSPPPPSDSSDAMSDSPQALPYRSSPMTQTERTRLRSLLVSGTSRMEEWLTKLDTSDGRGMVEEAEDYEDALERLGLQQRFDDMFSGTLAQMGSLTGSMNLPEGMEGTC